MKGDIVWKCQAWAVTPVHIGSGEDWIKTDYLIRDHKLCRFDFARVVLRLDPRRRRDFEYAVERGKLKEAHSTVREAVNDSDIVERIPLGPVSEKQLLRAQDDEARWGEVKPFIRSGGRPFIPGSSIKGAIRTALLNYFVQKKGLEHAQKLVDYRKTSNSSTKLQEWAFNYSFEQTEQDPLRFLWVSDAPLPEGATRIDPVINWHPGFEEKPKMQMHVERLLAMSDHNMPQSFTFEIRLLSGRLAQARRYDGKRVPTFSELNLDLIEEAIKDFYWKRWDWEINEFYKGKPIADYLRKSLFRQERKLNGTEISLTHQQLRNARRCLLLRLGRFTQFESKSVDGLRRGYQPQKRTHVTKGKTRNLLQPPVEHVSRVEPGVPMGWVLVYVTKETRDD